MGETYKEMCRGIVPKTIDVERIVSANGGPLTVRSVATASILKENIVVQNKACIDSFVQSMGDPRFCRAILVTDDENAAMKAALLLTDIPKEYGYEEDDWEYVDVEFDDEDMFDCEDFVEYVESRYAKLDIRDYLDEDRNTLSSFLTAEDYWNKSADFQAAMFLGIEAAPNLKSYINAVACCTKNMVFLHVPKNLIGDVDVQRLVYDQNFKLLELPENEDVYYECIAETLVAGGSYKLFSGFDAASFVKKCRQRWQKDCSEDRIASVLDFAAENAGRNGRGQILAKDFEPLLYLAKKDAYDDLMDKVGLESLKDICKKFIAMEKERKRNPKAYAGRKHMLFYGKPGTGKTTGALMLAKVMAEEGIGNGKCVVATRKDLIGAYVGHTAPRVAAKFKEAKGGILFVDEAGFFTHEESGGYVKEALKEFVRYMETCEDVTVIFAMYPKERKQFLGLDEGLTSRIAHQVQFEDYSCGELVAITEDMLSARGYRLSKGFEKPLEEYFRRLRSNLKETFGNARESRKLVDSIVLEISLRNQTGNVKNPDNVTLPELKKMLERAYELNKNADSKEVIGFQFAQSSVTKAAVY